jgi:hypothetical protein
MQIIAKSEFNLLEAYGNCESQTNIQSNVRSIIEFYIILALPVKVTELLTVAYGLAKESTVRLFSLIITIITSLRSAPFRRSLKNGGKGFGVSAITKMTECVSTSLQSPTPHLPSAIEMQQFLSITQRTVGLGQSADVSY